MFKIAFDPKTKDIIVATETSHAVALAGKKQFDRFVRAIYFKDLKTLYFRFYKPSGDYTFIDDEDKAFSFNKCYDALEAFKKADLVSKKAKVLFWTTNETVTEQMIKF